MAISSSIKETIRKYAIRNALEYGKAQEGSVLSKVISKAPEVKSNMAEFRKEVKSIVDEVNGLSRKQLEEKAKEFEEEFTAEYKEKLEKTSRPSFVIEGAEEGKFKTRFPPEPNGYMHIGHAKAAFIEQELARLYKGKCSLYFDDTNPENEKQEFVDAFKKDFKWLGLKFDEEYYASDNIERMYGYAEQLIKMGKAYVCDCDPEKLRQGREKGIACKHKRQTPEFNLKLWRCMLEKKGLPNTVLLFNGDLKAENTVMRDPVLFRIKEMPHYRQGTKYIVWPTYNLNTPIMDSMKGITDTVRSKEYELRDELYNTLLNLLKLRKPRIHSIARLEISGNMTSKRKLNKLIEEGLVSGYDDPRLVTVSALRKRGILPAAIREFVLKFGMSKTESKPSIDELLAYNRKLIDKDAARLFFVKEPMELKVEGIPATHRTARMSVHPNENLGTRKYELNGDFIVSRHEAKLLKKGSRVRLKDLFNVTIRSVSQSEIVADYDKSNEFTARILWLADGNYEKCTLTEIGNLLVGGEFNKDSLKETSGYVENYARELKEGAYVQLEMHGFFRLDDPKKLSFLSL